MTRKHKLAKSVCLLLVALLILTLCACRSEGSNTVLSDPYPDVIAAKLDESLASRLANADGALPVWLLLRDPESADDDAVWHEALRTASWDDPGWDVGWAFTADPAEDAAEAPWVAYWQGELASLGLSDKQDSALEVSLSTASVCARLTPDEIAELAQDARVSLMLETYDLPGGLAVARKVENRLRLMMTRTDGHLLPVSVILEDRDGTLQTGIDQVIALCPTRRKADLSVDHTADPRWDVWWPLIPDRWESDRELQQEMADAYWRGQFDALGLTGLTGEYRAVTPAAVKVDVWLDPAGIAALAQQDEVTYLAKGDVSKAETLIVPVPSD